MIDSVQSQAAPPDFDAIVTQTQAGPLRLLEPVALVALQRDLRAMKEALADEPGRKKLGKAVQRIAAEKRRRESASAAVEAPVATVTAPESAVAPDVVSEIPAAPIAALSASAAVPLAAKERRRDARAAVPKVDRAGRAAALQPDRAERRRVREAERAEKKRVKELEKAERQAARKAEKQAARKAEKQAARIAAKPAARAGKARVGKSE
jgi:hypothetical protein